MENFETKNLSENIENKYGKNVKIHAIFLRHGEKETDMTAADTGLTERGRRESLEIGRKLDEKDLIKAYSSDTDRTKESAELIVFASPTEKKMKHRIEKELSFYYDKNGVFFNNLMKAKKEMLGNGFKELQEEEKKEKMEKYENWATDYYLSFSEQRPDESTMSPVETAAIMAKRVETYIKMADRLRSNSDIQMINDTHDLNLAAFLKEALVRDVNGQKIRGFKSIEEIGGSLAFNEGFEIIVENDEEGKKNIKFVFRGRQYELDFQRLNELSKIAKDVEKKF